MQLLFIKFIFFYSIVLHANNVSGPDRLKEEGVRAIDAAKNCNFQAAARIISKANKLSKISKPKILRKQYRDVKNNLNGLLVVKNNGCKKMNTTRN